MIEYTYYKVPCVSGKVDPGWPTPRHKDILWCMLLQFRDKERIFKAVITTAKEALGHLK